MLQKTKVTKLQNRAKMLGAKSVSPSQRTVRPHHFAAFTASVTFSGQGSVTPPAIRPLIEHKIRKKNGRVAWNKGHPIVPSLITFSGEGFGIMRRGAEGRRGGGYNALLLSQLP